MRLSISHVTMMSYSCLESEDPLLADHAILEETRSILRSHGLGTENLVIGEGFANSVVLSPHYVIRLNDGRFAQAFAHEARVLSHLPSTVPHPKSIAHGNRSEGGEYLVIERLPGVNLQAVWAALSPADRQDIARQLAHILHTLHEIPQSSWMENPWVSDVVQAERWRDAYHVPARATPKLIASASRRRPDLLVLLDQLSTFVEERSSALDQDVMSFTHTDVHFRNIVVANTAVTGLIDFEGSRLGARDVDLDMLIRTLLSSASMPGDGYGPFLGEFRRCYPSLFSHAQLIARLEIYEAQWHLIQLHHWTPGVTWMADPTKSLRGLVRGDFADRVHILLDH